MYLEWQFCWNQKTLVTETQINKDIQQLKLVARLCAGWLLGNSKISPHNGLYHELGHLTKLCQEVMLLFILLFLSYYTVYISVYISDKWKGKITHFMFFIIRMWTQMQTMFCSIFYYELVFCWKHWKKLDWLTIDSQWQVRVSMWEIIENRYISQSSIIQRLLFAVGLLTPLQSTCASLLISLAPAACQLILRFSKSITRLSKVSLLADLQWHVCT